jgi:3-phosphoshikimate 1-carboxyvinyltransferase
MEVIISPGKIKGSLHIPASKSMMQRALAGALLHKGTTTILNPGYSADERVALNIIIQLGAIIKEQSNEKLVIVSEGRVGSIGEIDCGESGLAARLFAPIAAISEDRQLITGHGTLLKRSMKPFGDILPQLGVKLVDFFGHIPFMMEGPLKAASIKIDGKLSSQYFTGLLFALVFTARKKIKIKVKNLNSKPYIDLTLDMLTLFGKKIHHKDYHTFIIDPNLFENTGDITITMESDWSSAAFWLVGGAIAGGLQFTGLTMHSSQGDKAIMEVLESAGAPMAIQQDGFEIYSAAPLRAFTFNATDTPDLFPILSVLALFCEGESRIEGMHRLKHKESNRAKSICEMLDSFGASYKLHKDQLRIFGPSKIKSCTVNGHNDHRIIMAAAIAALRAEGPVTITTAENVSKSYPEFFNHLAAAGGQLTKNDFQ